MDPTLSKIQTATADRLLLCMFIPPLHGWNIADTA